jgi:hypothetical protein
VGDWRLPQIRPSWRFALLAVFLLQFAPAIVMAEERVPGIKRFDRETKAKVLAALAGLIILGFAMVALTWLGARIVERYRHRQPYHNPTPRPGEHDWAKKPLTGPLTSHPTDNPGGNPADD